MSRSTTPRVPSTPHGSEGREGHRVQPTVARHDYLVLDTIECGLVLAGSEVKSLRDAKVQIGDAYARVERGELWLHNMHIAPYEHASGFGAHEADRPRKLLAHHGEIDRLGARVAQDHLTLIPLALYFKEGRAKVDSPSRKAARATTAGRTWRSATRIGRCSVRWRTTDVANDAGPSDRVGVPFALTSDRAAKGGRSDECQIRCRQVLVPRALGRLTVRFGREHLHWRFFR